MILNVGVHEHGCTALVYGISHGLWRVFWPL